MNTGRSFEEKFYFCWSKYPFDLKPCWVQGFADGEGSFYNKLSRREKGGYSYVETESIFKISQNMHDVAVLLAIKEFFGGTGHLYPKLDPAPPPSSAPPLHPALFFRVPTAPSTINIVV